MKSIELFAGAGGLAIGTSRAGFRHDAVIEWDRNACQTLRLNATSDHGHADTWNVHEGDVGEYDFSKHQGRVEFISGGPPCQPFSMGGKHRGQADARNMFPHAVRDARVITPGVSDTNARQIKGSVLGFKSNIRRSNHSWSVH